MIKVLNIIAGTAVDGPGLRTSIYFSGCTHQCEGCHNPQSWDFNAGKDMTEEEIIDIVEENGFNVTFTGGDPMCRAAALVPLAKELKSRGYNIWCYTGYTFEQLAAIPECMELASFVDVIVDGPYVNSLRDISLRFRGSSNQRLIDVHRSTKGDIVLWDDNM